MTKDPADTTAPLIHRSAAGYADGTRDAPGEVALALIGGSALTGSCHCSHWLMLLCTVACTSPTLLTRASGRRPKCHKHTYDTESDRGGLECQSSPEGVLP